MVWQAGIARRPAIRSRHSEDPARTMASDDLIWKLGARLPGQDYRVFRTGFVDGAHPRTGAIKRFSVLDCDDWVNIVALTPDERVVLLRQFRVGAGRVCLEIPGGIIEPGEDPCAAG